MTFEEQMKTFNALGYKFNEEISKELILNKIRKFLETEEPEKLIQKRPFELLYHSFGYKEFERGSEKMYKNYSENCILFCGLDFFDSPLKYIWFMKRMGEISKGQLHFKRIEIYMDKDDYEWIRFEVNGVNKNWRLEKKGFIASTFIEMFSLLPNELNEFEKKNTLFGRQLTFPFIEEKEKLITGKYTIFDSLGLPIVIDFATDEEDLDFTAKTGLKRNWICYKEINS